MPVKPVRISPHARFEMSRRSIRPGEVVRTILPSRTSVAVDQRPGDLSEPDRSRTPPHAASRGGEGASRRIPCRDGVQDQQGRQVLEDAVKVIYDKETDTLSIILR